MSDWYEVRVSINGGPWTSWWEGPLESCKGQKIIQESMKIPSQKRRAKIYHVETNKEYTK